MPTTISVVARAARVSASTVSRVLNGTATVHPAKRRRVLLAVRRLRYEPNDLARSLRRRRSHTIALVVPDITNPFFAEIAKGVEDTCQRVGYSVFLCNSGNDVRKEQHYLEVLRARQVDGLVLVPAGQHSAIKDAWVNRGLPVVLMDRTVNRLDVDAVVSDNEFGMGLLVEHLVTLGHRKIGFIGGPKGLSTAELRLRGFLIGMKRAGLAPERHLVVRGKFTVDTGRRAAQRLLAGKNRPTAIIASSDVMALGAIRAMYELGHRVPDTVSLAGFDDIAAASLVQPPLTTVSQDVRQIGKRSVEMLIDRIEGRLRRPQRLVLRPRLVVRDSTGPPGGQGAGS